MAKAVKHVEQVTTDKVTVTLTLDAVEAEVVTAVLARVGGDPDDSYRMQADAVFSALRNSGVSCYNRPISKTLTGTLMFGERG